MAILAAVAGLVLGAWIGDGAGAAAGAVIGWLTWRSLAQQRRIDALQRRLDGVGMGTEAARASAQGAAAPATDSVAEPMSEAAMSSEPADEAPATDMSAVPSTLAATNTSAATSTLAAATLPNDARPRERRDAPAERWIAAVRGWLFGGNTIVKAGVAILFVGLAFLARFATEHVHVPVGMRLAGIAAVAVVLLVVGWRLRLRRPGYAQVLQGGAVAVLYLTLFVAFGTFSVLPMVPTFVLMTLVCVLAAALAVLQDARALAMMGALGGFATPLLASNGSGNQVALFSYYLVLDAGIALVAWHKTWRMLNLVGFLGTFGVATAWGVLQYRPEHYASAQSFLVAYFLLFNAILLAPARRAAAAPDPASGADRWVQGSLLFGLPTIAFVLQAGLVRDMPHGTAFAALGYAAFYVALAALLRAHPRLAAVFEGSLAVGTIFLTLVIPFALDARSTAGAWALEAAGLVWIGLRQSRRMARLFGYALFVLSGAAMLLAQQHLPMPTGWANAVLFNGLMAAAAALIAARAVERRSATLDEGERLAEPLLVAWAVLWLAASAGFEIDTFVSAPRQATAWMAAVSAIAVLLGALSVRLDWRTVAWPTLLHAPALAVGVLATAESLGRPSADGGAWAWPLALAVHLALLRFVAPRWPQLGRAIVHGLGVLVLAALGALEGRAITAEWGSAASAWLWLGWLVVPALLLLALPRAGVARRWPVCDAPSAYRAGAATVLALGLWCWTLIANVASDGSAQPLPHVPFANPLDLGIGLALVAIAAWRREVPEAPFARGPWALPMLGAAVFVWLNAILVRGFHHYAGVPYHVDAWIASLPVQTGLTLLWTAIALALMWFAARLERRPTWIVGAALLAIVVVKLLLVDLSGSGTVARIVSFIGVGVLMLVIGYVAPLPTKEAARAG